MWEKLNSADTDPLATSVSPASGAWLANNGTINNTITINFNTSINTSPAFAGTMTGYTTAWTERNVPNDTLTITITTSVASGPGTISITATTTTSETITVNLNYNIANSVYYVRNGSAGTGTRTDPMNSIQTAVNASGAAGGGVVLVAAGTYTGPGSTIVSMNTAGVWLLGGYSASNWDLRNPSAYISRIERTDHVTGSIDSLSPIRLVEIFADIIIDGFNMSIESFDSGYSAVIFINSASPEISNNVISSGNLTGTGLSRNYGIFCLSSNPLIHNNSITAGTSSFTGDESFGIFCRLSGGSIYDNQLISGGYGQLFSNGIYLSTSSTTIQNNNHITASSSLSGGTARGLHLTTTSSSVVNANVIASLSANSARGIQISSNSTPVIRNNYISCGNNQTAFGILVNNDHTGSTYTDIYNNVIDAGQGVTTIGVYIYTSDTMIRLLNNTINGGGGTNWAYAVSLELSTAPANSADIIITNNNIFTDSASVNCYGIYEDNTNSHPGILSYNNVFHCNYLFRYYDSGGSPQQIASGGSINGIDLDGAGALTVQSEFNLTNDVYSMLDRADQYRFTGNPLSVSFDNSGYDGSAAGWGFNNDRDGVTRTVIWSIGAYEYD